MGTNENIVTRLTDVLDSLAKIQMSQRMSVVVDIKNDDMLCIEQIQFSYYDFSYKSNYYRNAYHPNGELKANPKICIVGFHIKGEAYAMGDSYVQDGEMVLLDGKPFKLNSISRRLNNR